MSAAWPLVVNRLVALLPTLPDWSQVAIYDGPPVTQDVPTDYVTVGYVVGEDFAGSFEEDPGPGDLVAEVGTVRSELVCQTGNTNVVAEMRTRAFALANAWQAEVRRDVTLGGVLTCGGAATLAVDVQPVQNTAGSAQRLTVTLSYTSRS